MDKSLNEIRLNEIKLNEIKLNEIKLNEIKLNEIKLNEINFNIHKETEPDFIKLQKMRFIYNAIESGWNVKKIDNKFVFSKKHEGKKEIYLETYLQKFIEDNMKLEE
jgi:hypothetical protein